MRAGRIFPAIRSVWSNGFDKARWLRARRGLVVAGRSILLALRAKRAMSGLAAASTEGVRCLERPPVGQAELAANFPRLRRAGLHPRPPVTPLANAACSLAPRRPGGARLAGGRLHARHAEHDLGCREVLALHGEEPGTPGGRSGGVELNGVLTAVRQDRRGRSNIRLLRAGRFKPGVVRLSSPDRGRAAGVQPAAGRYGHRLVLDVYPAIWSICWRCWRREEGDEQDSARRGRWRRGPATGPWEKRRAHWWWRLVTITLDPARG